MRSLIKRERKGVQIVNKYDHAKKIAALARTKWFKDHVVDLRTDGSVTVVDFHKPGTSVYAVRYIFAGSYVYVSGDLGSAVFHCTWPVMPTNKHWNDRWYIYEKLEAARRYDFDEYDADVCVTCIKNTLLERDKAEKNTRFPENWDAKQKETFRELIKRAKECAGRISWSTAIADLNADGDISNLDNDWWEWLDSAGEVMPPCIVGIIEGLQIISEKLNKQGENS